MKNGRGFAVAPAQWQAVQGRHCLVCARAAYDGVKIDPAHVIHRSVGGCDEPPCVVPLCREDHRLYDEGKLDLLPYLDRQTQAHAVSHVGLLDALQRITNRKWYADE